MKILQMIWNFAKYLEVNNLHLLLGSRYILKNRDYRISAEYNKIMEDYETVYTAVLHNGIALKQNAIEVCIHDIDVSIHSPSIQEEVVHLIIVQDNTNMLFLKDFQ